MSKTGKNSLSDSAIIMSIGQGLRYSIQMVLSIILVRLLSKEFYGTYRQIWLVYGSFSSIFLLGLPRSIFFFYPTLETHDRQKFMQQTILFLFLIGAISAIIIFIAAPYFSEYFNNKLIIQPLKIFSGYILFSIANSYFVNYLIAKRAFRFSSLVEVINSVLMFVSVIIPIAFGLSLNVAFTVLAGISFVIFLLYFSYSLKEIGLISFRVDSKLLLEQIKYSLPLGLSAVMAIWAKQIDKYVISISYQPDFFAIYAIGALEIPVFAILNMSVNNVLRIEIAKHYKNKNIHKILILWHDSIRKQAIVYIPFFVLLFLLSDELIAVLYTIAYLKSAVIFRIYLIFIPIRSATYSIILTSSGKTRTFMNGQIINLCSNLILSIILVKAIGWTGPALATIITLLGVSFYYLISSKKLLAVKLADIFPWKILIKIFIISILSISLFYVPIKIVASGYPLLLIGVSTLGLVLFVFVSYCCGIITESEKSLVKRWLALRPLFTG